MWQLVIVSALAATPAAPKAAEPPTSILVLTTGQAMTVRSYRVDGRMVRIVDEKGQPLIMRTEQLDLERSEKATEQRRAKLEAEAEAERMKAEAVAEERRRRAERNAEHKRTSTRGGGGFAVAGDQGTGSAAPVGGAETVDGEEAEELDPAGESAELVRAWKPRFDALRSQYREAQRRVEDLTTQHDDVVARHNATKNYAERSIMQQQLGQIRNELEEARKDPPRIEREYADLQEEARRARVPPVAYRNGVR